MTAPFYLSAGVALGLLLGTVIGVRWVHPWRERQQRENKVPLVTLDRKHRDIDIEWVRRTRDGNVEMPTGDGDHVPVPVDPNAAWTWKGQGRAWIIDKDTRMCMEDAQREGEGPVIEPPETTETLMEWARGVAERNFYRGEPEGLAGLLGKHMPLMVLAILVLVVGLVGIVGASAFGMG